MPRHRALKIFVTLVHPLIAGIAECLRLVAVQRRALDVHDARQAADDVDQAVELRRRASELRAGRGDLARHLVDAPLEAADALGEQVAGLGGHGSPIPAGVLGSEAAPCPAERGSRRSVADGGSPSAGAVSARQHASPLQPSS